MTSRVTRDQMLMEVAYAISKRGTCERGQVGAVIARENRPISAGYVGAPSGMDECKAVGCEIGTHDGCIRTVHAEANCIAFASRFGAPTDGSTIYTTLSPCSECAKLIINAGIARVVYATPYRDSRGLRMLEQAGVEVEIIEW